MPSIITIVLTTIGAVLLGYWAWYTFLMLSGLILMEQPASYRAATSVAFRELPKALLLGLVYVMMAFWPSLPGEKIASELANND